MYARNLMKSRDSASFSNCCDTLGNSVCHYSGYIPKIWNGNLAQKHESAGATALKTTWNGLVAYSTSDTAFSGLPQSTTVVALGSQSFSALSWSAAFLYPLYTYKKFVDQDEKAGKHKKTLLKSWHQLCEEIEKAFHLLQTSKDKQEKAHADIQKLLQANYNIPALLAGLQDVMQGLNLSLQMMSKLQQIIKEANDKDGVVKLITQQDARVQQHQQTFDPRRVELDNLKTLLAEIENKVHDATEGEKKIDILFHVHKLSEYTSAFAQPLKTLPARLARQERKEELAIIESKGFDPSQSALQAEPQNMPSTAINYASAFGLGALSLPLNYLTSESLIVPLFQAMFGTSPAGVICTLGSEILLLSFLAIIKFQDTLWEDKRELANEKTDENMEQLLNHTRFLKESCERIRDSSTIMAENVKKMLEGIIYFLMQVKQIQGKLETIFLYFNDIKIRIKELDKLLIKAHPAKLKSLGESRDETLAEIKNKGNELEGNLKQIIELFSEITKAVSTLAESEVVMQQARTDIASEKKAVEQEQNEIEKQYKETVQTIKAKQTKHVPQRTYGQRFCDFFRSCCRRKEPEEVTRVSSSSPVVETIVKIQAQPSREEFASSTTLVLPLASPSSSLELKNGEVGAQPLTSPSETKSSTTAITAQLPLLAPASTVTFAEPVAEVHRPITPEVLPNQVPPATNQNIVSGPTGLRKASVVGGNKSRSSSSGSSGSLHSNVARRGYKARVIR